VIYNFVILIVRLLVIIKIICETIWTAPYFLTFHMEFDNYCFNKLSSQFFTDLFESIKQVCNYLHASSAVTTCCYWFRGDLTTVIWKINEVYFHKTKRNSCGYACTTDTDKCFYTLMEIILCTKWHTKQFDSFLSKILGRQRHLSHK
jgi:hypothetical protein